MAEVHGAEENGPAHSEPGHHYPTHIIGVFFGATDGDSSDFTIGAEYEYRFNQRFGLGVVLEKTPEAHHGDGVSVALGVAHFHPFGGLRLSGGIGAEFVNSHEKTLYRLGAAYDFELGAFAIAPTVNVDFVDNQEVFVYGVVLSSHF